MFIVVIWAVFLLALALVTMVTFYIIDRGDSSDKNRPFE